MSEGTVSLPFLGERLPVEEEVVTPTDIQTDGITAFQMGLEEGKAGVNWLVSTAMDI